MKTFAKWFLAVAATVTLFVLSLNEGLVQVVVDNDFTYISLVIGVVFVLCTLWNLFCIFPTKTRLKIPAPNTITSRMRISHFCEKHFFSLGILGTLIGFTKMMFDTLVAGEDIELIIQGLRDGLATALITTIVGIVASVFLGLQTFIIEYDNS